MLKSALTVLIAFWNPAGIHSRMIRGESINSASVFAHLAGGSHVAVRRHLASAIQHGMYNDDEIASYRKRYIKEMQARQAVYFLHVSKTAGSFLCECASLSGCNNYEGVNASTCHDKLTCGNCHAPFNWAVWGGSLARPLNPLGARSAIHDTCAGTAELLALRNVTVEGNERYMISEGLCPQFWNVMILRSPVERLASHLSMIELEWSGSGLLPPNATLQDVNNRIPAISNNFFIRSLLGQDVYELPIGQITALHLERAKRVLEGFDLVFVQDETLAQRVKDRMGWSCVGRKSNTGNTDDYLQRLKQSWTPADWKELHINNEFDELLLKHAGMLEEADQTVFDHPLFARSSISERHLCK
jgi:hypothetical protein